ncbi:MAG: YheU family protein [Pseudomonadales bacterium]|nr:YheU family protein [Pseudomonadales bacterium]
MEIPFQALNPDTLNNLIQELVTRDGTDYGESEISLAEKVEQVKLKLMSGEALILYDEQLETCEIRLKDV